MKNSFFVVFVAVMLSVSMFTSCSDDSDSSYITPPPEQVDPAPTVPAVTLDKNLVRLEVGETVALTATANASGAELVWKAPEDQDALTLTKENNALLCKANKTGIFTINVYPKDSNLLYGDSCCIAVTMKGSAASAIVGAWKYTSHDTDGTATEKGFWFKQDGTLHHLSKNDADGKFYYRLNESRNWIQTAFEDGVYSFTLYERSSNTSSDTPLKLQFNEDGTFQSMGSNHLQLEKLDENNLVADSN